MTGWSSNDIGRLDGRRAVVTGANSGLGYATALALATHGAEVILACRDQTRGAEALASMRAAAPLAQIELRSLDLADLSSIRDFATWLGGQYDALDILVNNAGVMAIPRFETADGFEMQFGTNHLGHFALTGLLLDSLLARPGSRVVTVTSAIAKIGGISWDDLQSRRHYNRWSAYGQAKLANQLFAFELDRRVAARGLALISVAAHPGYAATNLQAVAPQMAGNHLQERFMAIGNTLFAQSAADGALPSLYGATAPDVTGGQYFGPSLLFESRGPPKRVKPVRMARQPEPARRLWEVSEDLTGVTFAALDRPGA